MGCRARRDSRGRTGGGLDRSRKLGHEFRSKRILWRDQTEVVRQHAPQLADGHVLQVPPAVHDHARHVAALAPVSGGGGGACGGGSPTSWLLRSLPSGALLMAPRGRRRQ